MLKHCILILTFLFFSNNNRLCFAQKNDLIINTFTLDNGFKVILNPDPFAKETYGAILVKAGSKNDPSDATGMAHYLEHLLFKGTDKLGTVNYNAEKKHLDSIVFYYDLLGKTTNDNERNKLQLLINNQSVQAAAYANPTEFDKLIKSIGGTGLNAFTQNDMTVYHNTFPGIQIEKWIELYAHRLIHPVFRSFQSELEVVYEEKNKGMDSPFNRLSEEMMSHVFKTHPYGNQSTIGTVAHLKNPSLTKMYAFFNSYYVANNMVLVLSGNFNPDIAIPAIKSNFSMLKSAPVPKFPDYVASKFDKKEVQQVKFTPIKIGIVAYKTVPLGHKDLPILELAINLLTNQSETGIFNKLQLDGKLLFSEAMNLNLNDDGISGCFFAPKIVGQSFEEAEKLIYAGFETLKKGSFSDESLAIIKLEKDRQNKVDLEDIHDRTLLLVQLESIGSSWDEYKKELDMISQISKEDIMRVSSLYFNDNHYLMESSMGFPKKEVITKPGFKPLVSTQVVESEYAKQFLTDIKESSTPKLLDFEKDVETIELSKESRLYITKNPINDVVSFTISYQVGYDSIPLLKFAGSLVPYFYLKEMSRDSIKKAFALLGYTYSGLATDNRFEFIFTGPESNLSKAMPIISKLVKEPLINQADLNTVIEQLISERKMTTKDPAVMGRVLLDYAIFGSQSEYLKQPSRKDAKKMKVEPILKAYQQISDYGVVFHYVGNHTNQFVKSIVLTHFPIKSFEKTIPRKDKNTNEIHKDIIYVVHNKNSIQSQVFFLQRTPPFSKSTKELVHAEAFNQYMSDGFSGLLMQEIREYRSLAYGTGGSFIAPIEKNNPGYFYAYVGCQGDKSNDAVAVLDTLLKNMPVKPERIQLIKSGLINSFSSNYPFFRALSSTIESKILDGKSTANQLEEFNLYKTLSFNDIIDFYKQNIQGQPRVITIYGDLKQLNMKKLAEYGQVIKLKQKDIFMD